MRIDLIEVDGKWIEMKRISFDKYIRRKILELPMETDEIRLTKLLGVEFNLDELLLDGNSPTSYERKLSHRDNDVIDVGNSKVFKFNGAINNGHGGFQN